MPDPRRGVSPPVAVALSTVGFFALVVAGFGMLSLLSDAEVLPVSGLGPLPGVVAVVGAVAGFAVATWSSARRPSPSFWGTAAIVAVAFLGYLVGLVVGAVLAGTDAARTLAAVGGFAMSWFAVVLASAALLAGWAAIALVRTHAGRPRWPWESRDGD